jgi:hypothetical protein
MACVRCTDVQARPARRRSMAAWCLDGRPQTARRFMLYQHCP